MANNKQSKKRILVNAKKNARNTILKSELKTELKKTRAAIAADANGAAAQLSNCAKTLDQAAAKGLISKKTASRKKSRLAKAANKAKAAKAE